MMTALTSVSSATAGAAGRPNDAVAVTEDRFLKLLIAQMRNQDPLNPLDNAQITSQMAQLSTVTGINKLAQLLQSLTASFKAAQSLQAAGLIGRGVLTEGNVLSLAAGQAMGGFELAASADHVLVQIKDGNGQLVYATDLGLQPAGVNVFQWDGLRDDGTAAADGTYRFEIQATQNGQPVGVTRLSHGTVASVSLDREAVELNLLGLGSVRLDQIKQIL